MNIARILALAKLVRGNGSGGGVSSWNDLTDKPTTVSGGDTLTWDGNMEGRTVVDMGGYPLVHVSDAVVTAKDVSNGYSMEIVPDGVREFPSDFAQEITDNVLLLNDETFLICCSADNCEVSAIGLVFPKRGVYFMGGEYSIKSLTIPGYTGFTKEVLKPEVLPEHNHKWEDITDRPFGEETFSGDTLTWDGNTEGREKITMLNGKDYYRVSDAVLLETDLLNGFSVGDADLGEVVDFPYSEGNVMEIGGVLVLGDENVLAIPADNCDLIVEGQVLMTFAKKGIYFQDCITSLTIPGYNGFETTTIKHLDEKYLPILTSPGGKKFKLSVDDSGAVTATEVIG